MKVPLSVRELFQEREPIYRQLREKVDSRFAIRLHDRWHYESRVKAIESFAQKLETGRFHDVRNLEDFFGCTIVVENATAVSTAEALVRELFPVIAARRP